MHQFNLMNKYLVKCSSFGNTSWQHEVQWVMVMPRLKKNSLYKIYHVKAKAGGVMRLWYFHLSSHQYHVYSEWTTSYWMSLNSLCGIDYILCFPVLSVLHWEVSISRDILTGLPYMQKLCTLTRNTLSDKKKGGFTKKPQQWSNIFVASIEFTLYARGIFLLIWMLPECFASIIFSELVNLRENSSSPVGNTEFAR